jgi:tetratricopeptide (TPR) repeat protein
MNADFGDFNNDGWLDVMVTNITTAEYLQEGNMLWYNNGPADFDVIGFTDVAQEAGVWDGGWGWGAKFFDAELDGDLDIVQLNGFITGGDGNYWYDLASWTVLGKESVDARNWPEIAGRSFSGREPTRFWLAEKPGVFRDAALEAGLESRYDGRGVACFDYDNDGDLDLYFANQGQPANLYRNDSVRGHWLALELVAHPDTRSNRDAIGARATLETGSGIQIRERDGGNGYGGQSDPRLFFGLGEESAIPRCEIRWPDGGIQPVAIDAVDRFLTVRQDSADYLETPRIKIDPPTPRRPPIVARPTPLISEENLQEALSSMEAELSETLERYRPASAYRTLCVRHDRHDRSIEYFERLGKERGSDWRVRIELALAYIDKIPTRGGLAAIVSKGTLAKRSLDQLDRVIEEEGGSWVAYYVRGMNHLYWPRALRHSDAAVADLERCVEMQRESGEPAPMYYLRAHVALGDAHAKAKRFRHAREAWREAERVFPNAEELTTRLAVEGDEELLDFVESARNLEKPIDTDLSFLDAES